MCHRVQGDCGKAPTLVCVLVAVVTSCVLCARVRGHVPRSRATENTCTRGLQVDVRTHFSPNAMSLYIDMKDAASDACPPHPGGVAMTSHYFCSGHLRS